LLVTFPKNRSFGMGLSTRASRLLHKCRGNDTIFVLQQNWFCCSCCHGRPQKFFPGGSKSTFCLCFCGCWRCNANWRIQKRKCPMLRQQLHTVPSL